MERLYGIDEHAGDLPCTPADDAERRGVHILEREAVVNRTLAAEARLHAVPPAVVHP